MAGVAEVHTESISAELTLPQKYFPWCYRELHNQGIKAVDGSLSVYFNQKNKSRF